MNEGSWRGAARVLMVESQNLDWLSHMTRLYRCAPEHVRLLSEDEAKSLSADDKLMLKLPEKCGTGVFQFRELVHQRTPAADGQVTTNPNPVSTQTNTETIAINPENNPTPPSLPSPPSSVHQPDVT